MVPLRSTGWKKESVGFLSIDPAAEAPAKAAWMVWLKTVQASVLTMLENEIIFLTSVAIDHIVFITKASTGHPSETD
jgi:hypothetical protein